MKISIGKEKKETQSKKITGYFYKKPKQPCTQSDASTSSQFQMTQQNTREDTSSSSFLSIDDNNNQCLSTVDPSPSISTDSLLKPEDTDGHNQPFQSTDESELSIVYSIEKENLKTQWSKAVQCSLDCLIVKCLGFKPLVIGEILTNFPLHLLSKHKCVIEGDSLHHYDCYVNDYKLFCDYNDQQNINICCQNLNNNENIKKLIANANDSSKYLSHAGNNHLTVKQLISRIENMRDQIKKVKCENLNVNRSFMKLGKTLDVHERMMVAIENNSIYDLHKIVKTARQNGKSIHYILGKMIDAVGKTYRPHRNKEEKQLGLVVLQYGGPALLDILSRALNLPSTSMIYRMLKSDKTIKSPLSLPPENILDNFSSDYQDQDITAISLKIDETFIEPTIKWNPTDNLLYGFCRNHACSENLNFQNYSIAENLSKKVNNNEIHIPKECTVILLGSQIVSVQPTARHR